jgi:hypothetical protein
MLVSFINQQHTCMGTMNTLTIYGNMLACDLLLEEITEMTNLLTALFYTHTKIQTMDNAWMSMN